MHRVFALFQIIAVILAASLSSVSQAVVYVKWDAPGPVHDGTSWQTAYLTVQEGLDAATTSQDEVWVAEGVYVEHIILREGVTLYGGFSGLENSRDQRDWTLHQAILHGSGDSVVTALSGITRETIIDGFTIRNGTGKWWGQDEYRDIFGGGIYCEDARPSVSNCMIADNLAGGGIGSVSGSRPLVMSSIISNNGGGGIRGQDGASCEIQRSVIAGNYGPGIMFELGSGATVIESVIADNQGYGIVCWRWGGIYAEGSLITRNGGGLLTPRMSGELVNNIIVANEGPGALLGDMSEFEVTNNAVVSNDGTGIDMSSSQLRLYNNIVAFNTGGVRCGGVTVWIRNNCVYENTDFDYSGLSPDQYEDDISADPLFADLLNGNYRLTAASPCIDAGAWGYAPAVDKDGFIRPQDGSGDGIALPDIGPYEYPTSLANAKAVYPEGHPIAFGGVVVTATFPAWTRIYAERPDRSSGMRIETDKSFSEGDVLNVYGSIYTDPYTGERFVATFSSWPEQIGRSLAPTPVGLAGRSLGGGSLGLQEGIQGSYGLNNIGLLVTIWGRVTAAGRDWFYVDDGSDIRDGTGFAGVYVFAPNMHVPSVDSQVAVTGISSCDIYQQQMVHILLPCRQADIQTIGE